ncbi:isopeptide-forming domain-containing fimbrial protein [Enterococcus sp. LJL99]
MKLKTNNKRIFNNYFVKFTLVLILVFLGGLFHAESAFSAEVTAGTWDEFKSAYENPATTKITLTNDVSYTGGTYLAIRTTSIEIDGTKPGTTGDFQNYSITLGATSLRIGQPTEASGYATMKLSNITVSNRGDDGTGTNAGFISTPSGYDTASRNQYGQYWTFDYENIYVPKGRTSRLARTPRAQMNFSGTNYVSTTSENFYLGGINFADGTKYYGEITSSNYSIMWFRSKVGASDTGTGDFIIGDNADVKLRNTGTGTNYPAIYLFFRNIEVGENSKFTSTVPGSALQFAGNGQKFTAKKGSVVTLTSLNSNPSIKDEQNYYINAESSNASTPIMNWNSSYATNLNMDFQKGSSLFIIGSTTSASNGLIQLGTNAANTNNVITIDNPEQFDIRNNGSRNNNRFDAVQVKNNGSGNRLDILNSNLSLWKLGTSFSTSADFNYSDVGSFSITKGNVITSSETELAESINSITTTSRLNISRITGLNSKPVVNWQYRLSDADSKLQNMARVVLGLIPDDSGLDENGNLTFIEQYAGLGLPVTISNSANSEVIDLSTDKDGYVSTIVNDFYNAGTKLTATATRGKLVSDPTDSEAVFKITPPLPAKVSSGKIYNIDTSISGKGAEPGAKLLVKVNGNLLSDTVNVNSNGEFDFPLTTPLSVGDKVELYLQDSAGLAPTNLKTQPLPITNNSVGNINPSAVLKYADATFEPATVYVVEKGVITKGSVGKNYSIDTDKIGVGSTLTYSVVVSNDEDEGSNIKWNNVELTDVLDEGLDFDLKTADVKVNGNSVENATYDANSRTLKVPLGTILPTTSKNENKMTVTFKAKVNKEKLLTTISNTAKASGTDDIGAVFERESNTVTTDTVLDTSLTVHFVDLDGNVLNDPIVIDSSVNASIDLNKNTDVQKVITKLTATEYQLMSSPNPSTIVISGKGDHATYTFDGVLKIISAPKSIDFGSLKVSSNIQTVDDPTIDGDLTVSDTRSNQTIGWVLSAKVTKPMTNDVTGMVMPNALKYNSNNGQNSVVLSGDDLPIQNGTSKGSVNISSDWGTTDDSNGVKLMYNPASMNSGNALGDFTGTIQWTLSEVPKL